MVDGYKVQREVDVNFSGFLAFGYALRLHVLLNIPQNPASYKNCQWHCTGAFGRFSH